MYRSAFPSNATNAPLTQSLVTLTKRNLTCWNTVCEFWGHAQCAGFDWIAVSSSPWIDSLLSFGAAWRHRDSIYSCSCPLRRVTSGAMALREEVLSGPFIKSAELGLCRCWCAWPPFYRFFLHKFCVLLHFTSYSVCLVHSTAKLRMHQPGGHPMLSNWKALGINLSAPEAHEPCRAQAEHTFPTCICVLFVNYNNQFNYLWRWQLICRDWRFLDFEEGSFSL